MGVSPSPQCTSRKALHHKRPANWPDPKPEPVAPISAVPNQPKRPKWWGNKLVVGAVGSNEQVKAVVTRCAKRKWGLFAAFPEYEMDDLTHIGLLALQKDWCNFNPDKSTWATFVYMAAWRDIRDEYRSRERRAKHEGQAAAVDMDGKKITQPEEPEEPQIVAVELLDLNDGESLPDWLSRVYMACKLAYKAAEANQKTRRGRKWFSPAQCAAAALLMVRSKLTTRGAQELFKDRPELCRALRFMHAPSQMFFVRSGKFVSRKLKDFSAMQERYFEGQKVESGEAA